MVRGLRWSVLACVCLSASALMAQSQKSPIKIGFAIDSLKIERWQTDIDEFQKSASEMGAEVLVRSADGDDDVQLKQAHDLLDEGIKVLVLVPHDTEKASRIVDAAHAKGIPVISYDRLVRNSAVDLFVGFDAFSVGMLQAQSLTEHAPKGQYILLGGSPSDANAKIIRNGQMKILQPLIDRGDITVAADLWIPDWNPTQAYLQVGEALAKMPAPPAAILASNDGTAGGAIEALNDKGLSGGVLVSGQDADLAAVIRIFEGTQLMTVYKPLRNEARQAAQAAVQLANHEAVNTQASMTNGSYQIKSVLLLPIGVTRQNVKTTVLQDGFQNLQMVKQGIPTERWNELAN